MKLGLGIGLGCAHSAGFKVTDLDNLIMYFDIASAALALSGTDVQSITKQAGSGNNPVGASGQEPVYDSNNNHINFPDANSELSYDGFSASTTHTFALKIRTPTSSVGGSKSIFGFGQILGALDFQARFSTAGTSNLALSYIQKDGGGSTPTLATLELDTNYLLLIEFTSISNCNLYVNDFSTITASFDPRDATDFDTATAFVFGDGDVSTNQQGWKLYNFVHTSDIFSSTEKSSLQSFLA